ncbi:hypothetical protein [Nocardioides sp. SYSU D00038]|uniref:hypothetical protein n=1 Tax=Nocardioides sp. SYSU D00038 TaxID=2812554 RepID=UPI00196810C0|nr:hypothetical protein [Nocardioides sp. SYSU D00038]
MTADDALGGRLADSLDRALTDLDPGPGDLAGAVEQGQRLRRRRRTAVVAGVAAGVVAAAGVGAGVRALAGDERPEPAPSVPAEGWERGADGPLSARHSPLVVWTGEEVVVLGGHSGVPCPPNADCAVPDDWEQGGAAWDPATDRWRAVTTLSPTQVDATTPHAVVDGEVMLQVRPREWWMTGGNVKAWGRLPRAPLPTHALPTVHDGEVAVVADDGRVMTFTLAAGWRILPDDPGTPRLEDGRVFATELGLLRTGFDYDAAAPDEPTTVQVDRLRPDDTWERLPAPDQLGDFTTWTGTHLVSAATGGADGGEVNGWDRWVPDGGRYDPRTGRWRPLPDVPDRPASSPDWGWTAEAAEGPLVVSGGRLYDDRTGTWTDLGSHPSRHGYATGAALADGRLVTFGGFDASGPDWDDGEVGDQLWVWTPPDG